MAHVMLGTRHFRYTSSYLLYILQLQLIANDRLEGERQHAKNAVEEYVYEIRDKLYGEYEQYISDAVSHEVLSSINTLQD